MQRLEVSGAVRLIHRSFGVKGLTIRHVFHPNLFTLKREDAFLKSQIRSSKHHGRVAINPVSYAIGFVFKRSTEYIL